MNNSKICLQTVNDCKQNIITAFILVVVNKQASIISMCIQEVCGYNFTQTTTHPTSEDYCLVGCDTM
jgi:hypothetical protein